MIVKFDSELHEIGRITTDSAPPISSTGIISQPDGSLFHFGMLAKHFGNSPIMGVAFSNADFSQQTTLAVDVKDLDDYPKINVAATTGEIDHFVTASRLLAKGFYDDKGNVNSAIEKKLPPTFSTTKGSYLVIQFVQVIH